MDTNDTAPSFLDALHARLLAAPDSEAIACGDERTSLARLWAGAWGVARALAQAGVVAGDRVALQLEPGPVWVEAWIGILLHGAVAAPLAPGLPQARLLERLAELEPAAWLRSTDPAAGANAPGPRAAAPQIFVASRVEPGTDGLRPWPLPVATRDAPPHRAADQAAAILYTSGTQARPKGVVLSHGNLGFGADAVRSALGLREDDRILCLLPLHHTYGLSQLLAGLPAGATVCLEPAPALPAQLLQRIAASGCSVLPATPTLVAQLAALREPGAVAVPRLRMITLAADALPVPRLSWLRQTWPGAAVWCMYGQTECGRASILPAEELEAHLGSVGRGLPGTELWLVDEAGRRVADGGVGELVVRGPHVMLGYWRRPQETQQVLRTDPDAGPTARPALHTGDLCRLDSEGYLFVEGRRDDLIKCRGERISPREIEAVLLQHPAVTECAVVGRPDPAMGQRIEAHVVLRQPIEDEAARAAAAAELAAHCRAELAQPLWPHRIQFHRALPKTEVGKLARGRLPHANAERDAHAQPAGPDPSLHP